MLLTSNYVSRSINQPTRRHALIIVNGILFLSASDDPRLISFVSLRIFLTVAPTRLMTPDDLPRRSYWISAYVFASHVPRWRKKGRCCRTCCRRRTNHRPASPAANRTIIARPASCRRALPWWARRQESVRTRLERWSSPLGLRIRPILSPGTALLGRSRARNTTGRAPRGSRPCTTPTGLLRTTASTASTAWPAPPAANARTRFWTARSTLVWRGRWRKPSYQKGDFDQDIINERLLDLGLVRSTK